MCHPGPEEKMQIPASPFIPFMKKDSLQRHGTSLPVFLPIVVYYLMFAEKSIQCLILSANSLLSQYGYAHKNLQVVALRVNPLYPLPENSKGIRYFLFEQKKLLWGLFLTSPT
ncbi:MAG TPA: hypothetical protein HPP58_02120 [Deltaproteobacteria bacterium]|nr:hypothetical protein [Deltaproteobacteria bacterium]HIJ41156.1 hypothetical protein [Deltaproteobacteria bacterium]